MTAPGNQSGPTDEDEAFFERMQQAVRAGVLDALLRHKRAGNPVAVWQDDKVVWLAPADIPIEPR